MRGRIGLLGDGHPAEELARMLVVGSRPRSVEKARIACDYLVAVASWPERETLSEVSRRVFGEPLPCLLVCREPRAVVVGPWIIPGEPGCLACAQARRQAALSVRQEEQRVLRERFDKGWWANPLPALIGPVTATVAALIADDIDRLDRGDPPRGRRTLHHVATATATVTRHRFLSDPYCTTCGGLPPDSAELAAMSLVPRPKHPRGGDRVRWLTGERELLLERYVDEETGVVAAPVRTGAQPAVTAMAQLSLPGHHLTYGYGGALDAPTSVAVAIAEALERLGGTRPGGKRTVVRGSYRELGPDRALDPRSLGLPTAAQVAASGGRLVDYHPGLILDWVYGYSFRHRRPVLVPEAYAYYGVRPAEARIAYECSNGCALGGCLEDAILYGILEVAERDAFLTTWYARLPVPRIDPRSARDPLLRAFISRLEETTGSRLDIFNTTMPEGIPCLWLMLVDERDRPDRPKAACGARSGIDPETTIFSGVKELASMATLDTGHHERRRSRARDLLADSDLVVEMADHALLYHLPEAFPRLSFLYQQDRRQSLSEAFPDATRYRPATDLTDDLRVVIGRFLDSGLDVIVVDQTTLEHRATDLRCVKVIIPGTLPMTFGHRYRRVYGFRRLSEAPVRLGYRDRPLTDAEINPYPHPFP